MPDMRQLLGNRNNYGSNRVMGNLTVTFGGAESYVDYRRSLDLVKGLHTTSFAGGNSNASIETTVFCSYPDQACVYHIESKETLPVVTVGFENLLVSPANLTSTACEDKVLRHTGKTQHGPPEGMRYAAAASFGESQGSGSCSDSGRLQITPNGKKLTIIWSAETNYDQKNGNAEAGFSFKGEDPVAAVDQLVSSAVEKGYDALLGRHVDDFKTLSGAFSLDLPDTQGSRDVEISGLISRYNYEGPGDPYIDNVLFDLSRYLLISSSRQNSLPANLQGRWTELLNPSWGADYHSNINIQMNYWIADQTGLADTQKALWNYFEDTWVPQGTETAKLLYGAKGWVVHNEMNIFGFTAMKDVASWANCEAPPSSSEMFQVNEELC
jgi:alpha-L-fucosidase 2